ncbi:rubredoxin [Skermanella aerolata]|uniref:Rubredoxin n=1 Tax=Skermanella aerolata TaxID=393310 RepID=A0A512DSA7_9PROT|nr:[NiFe]-hydrogenase assembly chaperone HybE [Skermanella aerolata]GEO39363.1 rubredoxin [Skermanella aerolata]
MTGQHAGTVMECGVCWTRYDPAEGDAVAQIPAGTPFSALHDDWRCPTCNGEKHRFLAFGDHPATDAEASPADSLAAAYRHIATTRMGDLPFYNHRLAVEAVGFQRFGDGWLGIVATPWFMNAVLAPLKAGAWNGIRDGIKVTRALPSGSYEFVAGNIEGIGTILNCSLFSPMFEFQEQAAVIEAAEAAMGALLAPEEFSEPEAPPPSPLPLPAPPAEVSRRHLLRGSFGS